VVVVDLDEGLDRLVVSQIVERDCRQTVVGAIAVHVSLHQVFGVTEEMRRHLDVVLLQANSGVSLCTDRSGRNGSSLTMKMAYS
jgi:hypothetical protein